MRKYYFLKTVLQGFADLWLLITFLGFLFLLSFVITGKDKYEFFKTKNSSLHYTNLLAKGYPVKAQLQLRTPPDTLLEFKGKNRNGSFNLPIYNSEDSMLRSVLEDTSLEKKYTYSKWVVEPSAYFDRETVRSYRSDIFDSVIVQPDVDIYATVNNNIVLETKVNFQTANPLKKFILGLQYWINQILMLLIAFFTSKLMRQINKDRDFLEPLYQKTFLIGFLFMTKILFNLVLSYVYTYWYGSIMLRSVPSQSTSKGFFVYFNPVLDFNFTAFLFAVVLIVLASLFRHAYELEQDKQMTI